MHEATINTKPVPVRRLLLDQLPAVRSAMHKPAINTKPVPVRRLLLDQLPAVWAGDAAAAAVQQDEALVTHAPKVSHPACQCTLGTCAVPFHPLSRTHTP